MFGKMGRMYAIYVERGQRACSRMLSELLFEPLVGLSTPRGPRDHGTAGPHPVHGTATGQPRDTTGQHFFPKNPPKRLTRAPNSTRSQPSPPGARAAVLSVPLAPRFLQHHGTPRDGTKCGRCVWGGYTMVPREPRAAPGWLDAGERRGAPPPSLAKCKKQLLTGKRVRGAINFACMLADNEESAPGGNFAASRSVLGWTCWRTRLR